MSNDAPENELRAMSLQELFEEAELDRKRLEKLCFIEGDVLVLTPKYRYEIALDRISDHVKLVGWLYHFSGKTWMDRKLLHYFIKIVSNYHGFKTQGPL